MTFRILALGHFDLRIGVATRQACPALGLDNTSWAFTHKGAVVHNAELLSTHRSKLMVGDTVRLHLDRLANRVSVIVNGRQEGICFEVEEEGSIWPVLSISQGCEVKIV